MTKFYYVLIENNSCTLFSRSLYYTIFSKFYYSYGRLAYGTPCYKFSGKNLRNNFIRKLQKIFISMFSKLLKKKALNFMK